jgi:hypothetical protein
MNHAQTFFFDRGPDRLEIRMIEWLIQSKPWLHAYSPRRRSPFLDLFDRILWP